MARRRCQQAHASRPRGTVVEERLSRGRGAPPRGLAGGAIGGFADAPPGAGRELEGDPAANVCSCQGVTRGEILHAIRDRALETVEQVAEHTRASTGCGGCRPDVRELLDAVRAERVGA